MNLEDIQKELHKDDSFGFESLGGRIPSGIYLPLFFLDKWLRDRQKVATKYVDEMYVQLNKEETKINNKIQPTCLDTEVLQKILKLTNMYPELKEPEFSVNDLSLDNIIKNLQVDIEDRESIYGSAILLAIVCIIPIVGLAFIPTFVLNIAKSNKKIDAMDVVNLVEAITVIIVTAYNRGTESSLEYNGKFDKVKHIKAKLLEIKESKWLKDAVAGKNKYNLSLQDKIRYVSAIKANRDDIRSFTKFKPSKNIDAASSLAKFISTKDIGTVLSSDLMERIAWILECLKYMVEIQKDLLTAMLHMTRDVYKITYEEFRSKVYQEN